MLKTLLGVRFRSLYHTFLVRNTKNKPINKGSVVLFAVLYVFLGIMMLSFSGLIFFALVESYHMLGLDWLYFAMAGLIALLLSVVTGIFATQNQIYDSKDNALLLVMPIPPRTILLSRLLPLLSIDVLSSALIMVPASVIYWVFVEFSVIGLLFQLLSLVAITLLAKAISGFLAWIVHKVMSKLNKSVVAAVFMVCFMGLYFWYYTKAGDIFSGFIANSAGLAETLSVWVWPLYAMGMGCTGNWLLFAAFLLICLGLFALLCLFLSKTFLRSATTSQNTGKRKKVEYARLQRKGHISAVVGKELRKFVSSPVYLTNMGIGIVMCLLLPVAAIIFKDNLTGILVMLPALESIIPLIICAGVLFLTSTMCISAPSVSLEGKNFWIMRALPLPSFTIIKGKLMTHILLTAPVSALSGLSLAVIFGCNVHQMLLCTLVPAAFTVANGLLGMLTGLKWALLDFINDAYPVKQSASVTVSMFSCMGFGVFIGVLYVFVLSPVMSVTVFLWLLLALLAALCGLMYKALASWGVRKWEAL